MIFFNDTATTEIYTLSLRDALPILVAGLPGLLDGEEEGEALPHERFHAPEDFFLRCDAVDRKSTRLNSSHANTSYAVFCLKKTSSPPSPPSLSRDPTLCPHPSTCRS